MSQFGTAILITNPVPAEAIEELELDEDLSPESEAPPRRTQAQTIGRYQLCFELAAGGMATVYLARVAGASGFEKMVALKRIHPHLSRSKKYIEMFLDEARIASQITHANVCSVFDFGESDGEYYMAMEYLVGEPLARLYRGMVSDQMHRNNPLVPLRAAQAIADAAEGLHAAHELTDADGKPLNVVHRDVSGRNLFVTYDGVVQVVDFGIASAREKLHHTSTGNVKGTFPYMAPEQLSGIKADRRADIWALGVVLWEMLALRRLFKKDTDAKTIYAVLSDPVHPPSKHRANIAPELDEIVLRALQRNPAERWQTAREMGQALREFLSKQNDVVGPAGLSTWMQEVFPQGEEKRRMLLRAARDTIPAMPAYSPSEQTDSAFEEGLDISYGVVFTDPPPKPPPKQLKSRKGIAALVGVACLIGLGGWFTLRSSEPEPKVEAPKVDAPEAEQPAAPAAPAMPVPTQEELDVPGQEDGIVEDIQVAKVQKPKKQVTRKRARRRKAAPKSTATPKPAPAPSPSSTPAPATGLPGKVKLITKGGGRDDSSRWGRT